MPQQIVGHCLESGLSYAVPLLDSAATQSGCTCTLHLICTAEQVTDEPRGRASVTDLVVPMTVALCTQ